MWGGGCRGGGAWGKIGKQLNRGQDGVGGGEAQGTLWGWGWGWVWVCEPGPTSHGGWMWAPGPRPFLATTASPRKPVSRAQVKESSTPWRCPHPSSTARVCLWAGFCFKGQGRACCGFFKQWNIDLVLPQKETGKEAVGGGHKGLRVGCTDNSGNSGGARGGGGGAWGGM